MNEDVYIEQFELEKVFYDSNYQLNIFIDIYPDYIVTDLSTPNVTILLLDETEYLKFTDSSFDPKELISITVNNCC